MSGEHDRGQRPAPATPSAPIARGSLSAVLALAFIGGTAATVWSYRSMSAMGEIPMPGGGSLSMVWLPGCGQTWLDAASAFVYMWTVMMATMMLPSSAPELQHMWQDAHAAWGIAAARSALLTVACCLLTWAAAGMIVFIVGNALAATSLNTPALARLLRIGSATAVVIAGAVQFTSWKARRIACAVTVRCEGIRARAACKQGVRLALHSGCCCANLMAVLCVVGVMDPWAMAAITAAMTLERLAPAHAWAVRCIGIAVVATGLAMIARTIGFR
jgi:predicted metal-binding membrane protein